MVEMRVDSPDFSRPVLAKSRKRRADQPLRPRPRGGVVGHYVEDAEGGQHSQRE